MSVDRKEIDLIIRTALQGGKTLSSVEKSILDIEKAIDAQAKAAKRGESSIDELKATLMSLKQVQDQLKDQASLIGQFQRLGKQISDSQEKVVSSSKAYADYKEKLDKAGTATDYQANKLIKLANATERNQQTLLRQKTDQESLAASLKNAGIAMDQLSSAEIRVRQSAAQLGVSIVKVNDAITTYADDLRAAKQAERALADEKIFQQKLDDAAKLNKAGEYVRFWTDALNRVEAAEEQSKIATALKRAADEAVAAARGYKTLGTAARDLSGPSSNLRQTIQDILDPSLKMRSTLAGVESGVSGIANAVKSIRGPVTDYREQVQKLLSAQKTIEKQAGMVDAYLAQVAALRQARQEFGVIRATVLQYADALRRSTGDNNQLLASLRSAQATLAQSKANLEAQVLATRALRESMREAGLATSNLASTQDRLKTSAKLAASTLGELKSAHDKYGSSVQDTARLQELFASKGRTTLSMLQRYRGEILAMVTANIGLYSAINSASKSLEAYSDKQAIQNQLSMAAGTDTQAIGEAYDYVAGQAERLGTAFRESAIGYAKFSAGAKLAGVKTQETRYIFESFSEAMRVMNLNTERQGLVFKALTDIMSKGAIQAEELKGQLGDSLPGIFGIAQEALKSKFPKLQDALRDGKVAASELLFIAEELRKSVSNQLPVAVTSLAANQNRLNNELFKFKVAVAEAGFAEEFTKLLKSINELFKTNDGQQFAKDMSSALGVVVKGLKWVVENIESVKIIGQAVFGIYLARALVGFGVSVYEAATKLSLLNMTLGSTLTLGQKLAVAFGVLGAAITGYQLGRLLNEQFLEARLAGIALVIGFEKLWARLKFGAKLVWQEIPAIFMDGLASVANLLTSMTRDMLGIMSSAARALGKNELADNLDQVIEKLTFRTGRVGTVFKDLRKELEADLKAISDIGDSMADDEIAATLRKPTGQTAPTVPTTSMPSGSSVGVPYDEKAAEKRARLKEQLENELSAINAKIERQEKDNLASRLSAIDESYTKLVRKIRKLGGDEAKEMLAQLDEDIKTLKLQETKKFNDALLKEQTDLQRKLEQIDAQGGRGAKTDLDARLDAVRTSYEQVYRDIADYKAKLELNGRSTDTADAMRSRLDAGVVTLQNLERQKYYEDAINAILEERKAKLELINVQEKTGLITAVQARERSAEVITQTQPKIEAVVRSALEYVDAMILAAEATGASTTALDTLKAKLVEARESARGLRTEFLSAAQVNEMLASGATNAFSTMSEAIGSAITGMSSWRDAIKATRNAFLSFAADFLAEIAKMILKQALLSALQNSTKGVSGGIGGMIAGAVSAMLKHRGGLVGGSGPQRSVSPLLFLNAPSYHGGGLPGLAPNEYPAILKKNEEVLTESSPRNVLNGGLNAQPSNLTLKMINMIDSGSVVSEGLATQDGERAFFNFIRANRSAVRQVLAS